MKARCALLVASLLLAITVFAGAKEIEGVDVIIKRKPRGTVSQSRVKGAEKTKVTLSPGAYTVTIAFDDPLPANPAAKSYFESRSNTVRVVKRADLIDATWLAFDDWPYIYSVDGASVTRKVEGIHRKGDRVEIEQQIEIGGSAPAEISITLRRLPPPPPSRR